MHAAVAASSLVAKRGQRRTGCNGYNCLRKGHGPQMVAIHVDRQANVVVRLDVGDQNGSSGQDMQEWARGLSPLGWVIHLGDELGHGENGSRSKRLQEQLEYVTGKTVHKVRWELLVQSKVVLVFLCCVEETTDRPVAPILLEVTAKNQPPYILAFAYQVRDAGMLILALLAVTRAMQEITAVVRIQLTAGTRERVSTNSRTCMC